MKQRFEDKAIVITGAGSGIGRACAIAFAREGGRVAVADIDEQHGIETVRQITTFGGQGVFTRCDVTSASDVDNLIKTTVDSFGGVDALHNNAGIVRYGTVVSMPEDEWDLILDVNLKAQYLACKFAIPEMRKRGGGAIVNTASIQAFSMQRMVAAYAASKGAVVSLTKALALDHACDNIRCNCIAPGSIQTAMLDDAANLFSSDNPAQAIANWGNAHPLGRIGRPEEVANLVLFLASEESSFCTGGCYLIDGGLGCAVASM